MLNKRYVMNISLIGLVVSVVTVIMNVPPFIVYVMVGISALFFVVSFFIKPKKEKMTLEHFIIAFTSFRVSIDTNANVFNALSEAKKRAPQPISEALEQLITALEADHSVRPFFEFANLFENKLIMHIMVNIYLLINHGIDQKRLWQFNYTFEKLMEINLQQSIAEHESSYELFNTSLYLGTGIVIITLMLNIVGLISGGIYG